MIKKIKYDTAKIWPICTKRIRDNTTTNSNLKLMKSPKKQKKIVLGYWSKFH